MKRKKGYVFGSLATHFDFHAYQTISAGATTPASHINIAYADGFATYMGMSMRPRTIQTMLTMMFVQRFIEFFKVRDRKAITSGIKNMIANSSKNSGLIIMPSTSPVIICSIAPGSRSPNIPEAKPATIVNSHSTEIFIFQSSRVFTSFKLKPKNTVCLLLA